MDTENPEQRQSVCDAPHPYNIHRCNRESGHDGWHAFTGDTRVPLTLRCNDVWQPESRKQNKEEK